MARWNVLGTALRRSPSRAVTRSAQLGARGFSRASPSLSSPMLALARQSPRAGFGELPDVEVVFRVGHRLSQRLDRLDVTAVSPAGRFNRSCSAAETMENS